MGPKRVMWVRRYQGQCRALRPLGHQGYRLRSHNKDQRLCSGYTLLYKGILIVCVSCKPAWRYALIIRIEFSFCCGEGNMVNLKRKLISLIPG